MTRRGLLLMLLAGWSLAAACTSQVTEYHGNGGGAPSVNLNGQAPAPPSAPLYTAHNLWFEKPDHMYSTGFHVGRMIPAGTQVTDVRIKRGHTNWIYFTTRPEGITYQMEFVDKHHPGVSVDQYVSRMITTRSFGDLTEGFTDNELTGVRQGLLRPGMRKSAVLVTYGYPPEVLTSTLQSSRWLFQKNRFQKNEVVFDNSGYLSGASTDMM